VSCCRGSSSQTLDPCCSLNNLDEATHATRSHTPPRYTGRALATPARAPSCFRLRNTNTLRWLLTLASNSPSRIRTAKKTRKPTRDMASGWNRFPDPGAKPARKVGIPTLSSIDECRTAPHSHPGTCSLKDPKKRHSQSCLLQSVGTSTKVTISTQRHSIAHLKLYINKHKFENSVDE
jgi:hypothetical protein